MHQWRLIYILNKANRKTEVTVEGAISSHAAAQAGATGIEEQIVGNGLVSPAIQRRGRLINLKHKECRLACRGACEKEKREAKVFWPSLCSIILTFNQ